jgi:hypothetical protein
MGPASSHDVKKFGIVDNVCRAVVLSDPFDNTSAGGYGLDRCLVIRHETH